MSDSPALAVLVGAGPGDAQLLTLAGAKWLALADVVVYDRLAAPALLDLASPSAERIYVGKSAQGHTMTQEQINQLLVDLVRQGKLVVRLKGGDPFVFGRGGEEADALRKAGLPFRIVPGVTAGIGGSAYAGIPVTDRRWASSVAFITGHEDPLREDTRINWQALAGVDTLVFYMGVGHLEAIARRLMEAGKPADTPCAVIAQASTPRQRTLTATLATVAQAAAKADIQPPALTIVGKVVQLREQIAWFEKLPLFGRRILVTRTRKQASEITSALAELGAEVIEAPTIDIQGLEDWTKADAAIKNLTRGGTPKRSETELVGGDGWLVLTSPNGVEYLFQRLTAIGLDARSLAGVKIAAVGSATAAALSSHGITADLVPATFTTESLAAELLPLVRPGQRVLLARADIAGDEIAQALRKAGATVDDVDLYRTLRPDALPPAVLEAIRASEVDWLTFASSSSVENFLALLGADIKAIAQAKIAAIGPVTAATLAQHGLKATVQADPHTIPALVDAIVEHERR